MSGSTIGGVIGGVIGFWVGGPAGAQVGWMLGSAVGGYIDPVKISAPDIGDAQTQTTSDGIPIAVCYGHTPPFFGNVIDGEQKARRIKGKFRRQGKGGPKVQDPDKYLITYAIGVAEGPGDIVRIRRNGQLVYDVTPGSQIPGDTAAFRSKLRIYRGTEDQLPDPSLEALHGVGNTPYYRGLIYVVVENDDVTDTGGAIPHLSFEVVKGGTTETITSITYAAPQLARFQDSSWPLVDSQDSYTFVGFRHSQISPITNITGPTVQSIIEQAEMYGDQPTQFLGWSTLRPDGRYMFDNTDPTNDEEIVLIYNNPEVISAINDVAVYGNSANCAMADDGQWYIGQEGSEYTKLADASPNPAYELAQACSSPSGVVMRFPLRIFVTRKQIVPTYVFGDPCELQQAVALPDAPSMSVDCDGNVSPQSEVTTTTGSFKQLTTGELVTAEPGRDVWVYYPQGPVLEASDPDFSNEAFWTAAYNEAVSAGTMPPGLAYTTDYPDAVSEIYVYESTSTVIEDGDIALRDVQEDIADRCNVPSEKIDCSELVDIIPGYLIAVPSTGGDCSRILQQVFFYDFPEFDGKLRAINRGGDSVGSLIDDYLIDMEDGDDQIRPQQVEYPKKLHLAYPDPASNYTITKQTAERISPDIRAVGEQMFGVPIPFNKDEAAQKVTIMHKIAWSDAEGRITLWLPEEYTVWVCSDCFEYMDRRWRIDKTDIQDGTNKIEAVYDRASNYQSTATGADAREPLPPTSSLIGPTRLEFINLSPLIDSNDKIGFYIGVCGILDGWFGYTPRISVDGGVTYTQYNQISQPAVMGFTETLLPSASPYVYDPDATVTVKVHGGEPESGTFLQLLNEANAAIIGEEVIQFATVTEIDERTFELTGLTRARHNTTVAEHDVHSRFVVLDGVNFLEAPSSWIGQSLMFDVTSDGTANGYIETHLWSPALIQTEWQPVHLESSYDGTQTVIEWIGRGRLGTTAAPFNSSFFNGYEVTFTDGVVTRVYPSLLQSFTYTDIQRMTDFGDLDPLSVSISAMNRITGASAPLTGTI